MDVIFVLNDDDDDDCCKILQAACIPLALTGRDLCASAINGSGKDSQVVRIRRTREANQEAVLLSLCTRTFKSKVIIFSGTKQAAHRLKILSGLAGPQSSWLHGNLTQAQRLDVRNLDSCIHLFRSSQVLIGIVLQSPELFRKQEVDFLIATDMAARGLDIIGVQTVTNYACPGEIDR
ncbi:hypothetical protein Bca52824_018588 [Brassica carinata]|uniref:Helicase C-terminal domain-containing protein n=1 Tax=Brassica carinata TaxID=52824 RepID=A0A8X7VQ01_BRACI|nr:hypothetical protein Bca52824_018588 [Brassica carinata]